MATLEELEARIAALEASQADYRAVLAAVNALLSAQIGFFARVSPGGSVAYAFAT